MTIKGPKSPLILIGRTMAVVSFLLIAGILTFTIMKVIYFQKSILPPEERIIMEEGEKAMQEREKAWKERHERFHTPMELDMTEDEKLSPCITCHTHLPHWKAKKVRALINMHTQYLDCLTCHLVDEKRGRNEFLWYSSSQEDRRLIPFGTRYDPVTGELIDSGSSMKIYPHRRDGKGELQPVLLTHQLERAKALRNTVDGMIDLEKKKTYDYFHSKVDPRGPSCSLCHSDEGELDFARLGFEEKRQEELKTLNLKGMLTKYEEFYIPELFERRR